MLQQAEQSLRIASETQLPSHSISHADSLLLFLVRLWFVRALPTLTLNISPRVLQGGSEYWGL